FARILLARLDSQSHVAAQSVIDFHGLAVSEARGAEILRIRERADGHQISIAADGNGLGSRRQHLPEELAALHLWRVWIPDDDGLRGIYARDLGRRECAC